MRRLFDLLLAIVCLLFTANLYYLGNLWFTLGIFAVLTLAASNIYIWQLKRLIKKSEREFEALYLDALERRGQGNGSKVRE